MIAVLKNGKWGYIDSSDKIVLDFQYDEATNFQNELALVQKGDKNIIINKKGKTIMVEK